MDVQDEHNHQREYLEKTVDSLKKKLKKDSGMFRGDQLRILHENTALLKEVRNVQQFCHQEQSIYVLLNRCRCYMPC